MLARSKLNNIESKIYEALINNENSIEGFTTIINEEKNYQELKESIRCCRWKVKEVTMKKLIWLKKVKKKAIGEVIERNEIINNSLES